MSDVPRVPIRFDPMFCLTGCSPFSQGIKMSITNLSRATARVSGSTVLVAALLVSAACASASRKENGAVIGTVAGATVGGIIGNNTGPLRAVPSSAPSSAALPAPSSGIRWINRRRN